VIRGIIFMIRNVMRWHDAPTEYGPRNTLYNCFIAIAAISSRLGTYFSATEWNASFRRPRSTVSPRDLLVFRTSVQHPYGDPNNGKNQKPDNQHPLDIGEGGSELQRECG
jgi:hypothetical protein